MTNIVDIDKLTPQEIHELARKRQRDIDAIEKAKCPKGKIKCRIYMPEIYSACEELVEWFDTEFSDDDGNIPYVTEPEILAQRDITVAKLSELFIRNVTIVEKGTVVRKNKYPAGTLFESDDIPYSLGEPEGERFVEMENEDV